MQVFVLLTRKERNLFWDAGSMRYGKLGMLTSNFLIYHSFE